MQIGAARALVDHTPLTPAAETELCHLARVRAAHRSTAIEGDRLTLDEAKRVIDDERAEIPGRNIQITQYAVFFYTLLGNAYMSCILYCVQNLYI